MIARLVITLPHPALYLAPFAPLVKCLKKQLQSARSAQQENTLARTNAYFVQQANTPQQVQPLVQTALQEITRLAPGALTKKLVPQAPTVPTKALPSVWSVPKAKYP